MTNLDYMGPQGGALALAFAAGCVATSAVLVPFAAWFWRVFFEGVVKSLKEDIAALKAEQAAEREQCAREIAALKHELTQMRAILLAHGNSTLRAAVQSAITGGE